MPSRSITTESALQPGQHTGKPLMEQEDQSSAISAPIASAESRILQNEPQPFHRLSIPFALRLPLMGITAGAAGAMLGLVHGSKEAGLRFRAENAHRLPDSQAGWYLYHKSKNYHAMLGGVIAGIKMGTRVAFWTLIFAGMEEGIDRGRAAAVRSWRNVVRGHQSWRDDEKRVAGNRDFLSTMFAGLGTAGAFSLWNRFPLPTAVRVAKLGAKVGIGFGLAQDVVSLLRGRSLGYVEVIKRLTFGRVENKSGHPAPSAVGG